jgi:hypothetical protein
MVPSVGVPAWMCPQSSIARRFLTDCENATDNIVPGNDTFGIHQHALELAAHKAGQHIGKNHTQSGWICVRQDSP